MGCNQTIWLFLSVLYMLRIVIMCSDFFEGKYYLTIFALCGFLCDTKISYSVAIVTERLYMSFLSQVWYG
jgi:hypothetical protein